MIVTVLFLPNIHEKGLTIPKDQYLIFSMLYVPYNMGFPSLLADELFEITFLDFIGLEDTLKISIGHDRSRHRESLFIFG